MLIKKKKTSQINIKFNWENNECFLSKVNHPITHLYRINF